MHGAEYAMLANRCECAVVHAQRLYRFRFRSSHIVTGQMSPGDNLTVTW